MHVRLATHVAELDAANSRPIAANSRLIASNSRLIGTSLLVCKKAVKRFRLPVVDGSSQWATPTLLGVVAGLAVLSVFALVATCSQDARREVGDRCVGDAAEVAPVEVPQVAGELAPVEVPVAEEALAPVSRAVEPDPVPPDPRSEAVRELDDRLERARQALAEAESHLRDAKGVGGAGGR